MADWKLSSYEGARVAVVLAGAVAKGAFEAGILSELVPRLYKAGARIVRLVGASAGALNAAVLAAGVRAGDPEGAVRAIADIWVNEGDLSVLLSRDLGSIWRGQKLINLDGVRRAVAQRMHRPASVPKERRAEIDLIQVIALLNGRIDPDVSPPATTFEYVRAFSGPAYDEDDAREQLLDATLASASFPIVFPPVELRDETGASLGPAIDGGTVNNTPLKYALRGEPRPDFVFVLSPYSRVAGPPRDGTFGNVDRLIQVLVHERLYRDLGELDEVNRLVARLDRYVEEQAPGDPVAQQRLRHELETVLKGPPRPGVPDVATQPRFRTIPYAVLCPDEDVAGVSFEGFLKRHLREQYLQEGLTLAQRRLPELGL